MVSVNEYRSPVWKQLSIGSIIVAIVFFGAWWFASSVLWAGIFRLIAFAGFATAVLAVLRLREKPKELRLEMTNNQLKVEYFKKQDKLKEELFERETIKKIAFRGASPPWGFLKTKVACKCEISFTDTRNKLSVFRYSGRDLLINRQDWAVLENFFASHQIQTEG